MDPSSFDLYAHPNPILTPSSRLISSRGPSHHMPSSLLEVILSLLCGPSVGTHRVDHVLKMYANREALFFLFLVHKCHKTEVLFFTIIFLIHQANIFIDFLKETHFILRVNIYHKDFCLYFTGTLEHDYNEINVFFTITLSVKD